jgi:hypothetical protein
MAQLVSLEKNATKHRHNDHQEQKQKQGGPGQRLPPN